MKTAAPNRSGLRNVKRGGTNVEWLLPKEKALQTGKADTGHRRPGLRREGRTRDGPARLKNAPARSGGR